MLNRRLTSSRSRLTFLSVRQVSRTPVSRGDFGEGIDRVDAAESFLAGSGVF
jgi:hypothetical protein